MAEPKFSLRGRRVWVAGHGGMVGSALVRRLAREDCEVLTVGRDTVDLRRQADAEGWIEEMRPDAIFMAAARVGGILANDTRPADFIYDNLVIETNITHAAYKTGVGKLLFLGSSCIYPKLAPQPMPEEALLTGPLEPTNEWYAVAKIAGIKLCQAYRRQHGCDFISAMPTNLYGPYDNFDLKTSHVAAALLVKTHAAKLSGSPTVEILGERHAPARIPVCRQSRRCSRISDENLLGRRACQHWQRKRLVDQGAGATDRRHRWISRRLYVRFHQARRNAAEATERRQAARVGLGSKDRSTRRPAPNVRMVPEQKSFRERHSLMRGTHHSFNQRGWT